MFFSFLQLAAALTHLHHLKNEFGLMKWQFVYLAKQLVALAERDHEIPQLDDNKRLLACLQDIQFLSYSPLGEVMHTDAYTDLDESERYKLSDRIPCKRPKEKAAYLVSVCIFVACYGQREFDKKLRLEKEYFEREEGLYGLRGSFPACCDRRR